MEKLDYTTHAHAPFRNKSLANLKNEQWKGVPGLEKVYQVSSYGRIKALARTFYFKGKRKHKKEKIILAGVQRVYKIIKGDYTNLLNIHLKHGDRSYRHSIPRLVYYCFVKPFALRDRKLAVMPKDGNGLNCTYKNLQLVRRNSEGRFKPVTQYSLQGKRIRAYKSIQEACELTGAYQGGMACVLNYSQLTAAGSLWIRGKGDKTLDLSDYYSKRKRTYKERRGIRVRQLTKEGVLVKSFFSVNEASVQTGIPYYTIYKAVKKGSGMAGGFIWEPQKVSK